jgi:hypothetical protein
MRDWSHRDIIKSPFTLKSERELEKSLLDDLISKGVIPTGVIREDESRILPHLPGGPWDWPSAKRAGQVRYISAILGALILTAPMIVMVLVHNTPASLSIVAICTVLFGVGASYFSPTKLPLELLSVTAAYTAVLVVFVGGTTS